MQLERRIPLLDRPEQIFIPGQRQIRVVAALEQELNAADRDRLVDLSKQLVEPEHVAVRRSDRPVECTEVAPGDADVRVVDVPIDDVGDEGVGVLAGANRIGQGAQDRRGCGAIELECFGSVEPGARPNFFDKAVDRWWHQ